MNLWLPQDTKCPVGECVLNEMYVNCKGFLYKR
ncbi:hypothetical protein C806_02244 [Lachnospiraceae bacterium 3-1]|nr:hypothetical protein C806_02244 [Lachnospiraceae bacterium 3-1]